MTSLAQILNSLLSVLSWIVIVHVIMSWLIGFNVINRRHELVGTIWSGLESLLQPVYSRIRPFLPNTGRLDLAPLVLILAIFAATSVISNNL